MTVSGGSFAVVLFLTVLVASANGKPAKDGKQARFEKNARVTELRTPGNKRADQTAGTLLQTLKEIEIINGTAKTDDKPRATDPIYAFKFIDEGADCFWGGYGTKGYKRVFPDMVWYEFPSTHAPVMISYRACHTTERPKKWKFVGSSEENCNRYSSWTELCGASGTFGAKDLYTCDVPAYITEKFRCLGIRVDATYRPSSNPSAWGVNGVRFWESARVYSV